MKKRLLALALALVMVFSLLPVSAFADTYSGTCGTNVTWKLDTSTGVLTISGSGAMTNYSTKSYNGWYATNAPWGRYYSSITKVVINSGVTSIGDSAFEGCSSLTSITIPNSVTSIGSGGSGAFAYCSSLTSITIPSSITSIGSYAFWYCSSLTSIAIPSSVTSIGYAVFIGCSSLTKISVSSSNTAYSSSDGVLFNKNKTELICCPGGISGSYTIPNSVTSIDGCAFYECSSLTSVTVPSSVKSIGEYAFFGCSSLTSITIPSSVKSIGEYAFCVCSNLTSITIPNSVTSIGDGAFRDCISLTNITIPNSVTSIRDETFRYCSSLTQITIPSSVTSIGVAAFRDCISLTNITIPNSVTSIRDEAFRYCNSLTQITIPSSVTSIGGAAFRDCSSLTSITIPSSVTSIGESAFYYCSSLTNITIPNSVTSIGNQAFDGCSSLTDVYYTGSASDWNSITINDSNAYLTNATRHYNWNIGDHDYRAISTTAPTCTTQGYTTYKCYICGEEYNSNYTYATGHDYSYSVTVKPTTSSTGVLTGKCANCNGTKTITLPKLNTDDYNYVVQTPANCAGTGTAKYTWTNETYGIFSFTVALPATEHTYTYSVTKQPTVSSSGKIVGTCKDCGSKTGEIVLPELNKTDYTYKVTKAATCSATGNGRYTWNNTTYGTFSFDVTIPMLSHSYVYSVTKQPTESSSGKLVGTCKNCGSKTGEIVLPALNKTDYTYKVTKAATCSAAGNGRYTWNNTTYGTFSFDVTIPMLSHSYVYSVTKQPTESSSGKLIGTCKNCGSKTGEIVLPALNKTDYTYKVIKEATYSEAGTGRYTWTNETYGTFSFDVTIPMLSHSYVYSITTQPTESSSGKIVGVCKDCGDTTNEILMPELNETDYTYEITKEATYSEAGTGTYTWNNTDYGTFSVDVTLPMLTLEAPVITATRTANSVNLTWNAVEGATGYIIQRKAATGTNWSDYDTTTNLSYTNSGITAGYAYSYRVIAYAGDVDTNSSVSADKTLYIGQVTGIAIAQQKKGVKVSWSKLKNASGYKVYRRVDTGSWKLIKTITSGSTVSYTDTASTNTKRNYYKVIAYRTISDVRYSSVESATKSLIYVAAPSLSSATNSGSGKITVKWTKNSSATGYRVKVMGTKLCSFYTISSPSTLSKVVTGKSKGTYKIYVQAYKIVNDKKYYSEWSSYKTVKVTK